MNHQPTVLVIDDDPAVGDLFRLMLESRDIPCTICRDGETAIDTWRSVRPALVVLDLALPGRGGQEILADMALDPDIADTPVVVVSGVTDGNPTNDETWRRRLDVAAYYSKPLEPKILLDQIQLLLNQPPAS